MDVAATELANALRARRRGGRLNFPEYLVVCAVYGREILVEKTVQEMPKPVLFEQFTLEFNDLESFVGAFRADAQWRKVIDAVVPEGGECWANLLHGLDYKSGSP
ncbi:MAG TPA: hypothetical protein VFF65_03700 [Phycisphaerales bacterium]|nr:hypothetical protein [Phycisphaerales bacterium]